MNWKNTSNQAETVGRFQRVLTRVHVGIAGYDDAEENIKTSDE